MAATFTKHELQLDPLKFEARMIATREWLERAPGTQVDIQERIMGALDNEIHYALTLTMQRQRGRTTIISYPADWWEAVKARFAPVWLLAHFLGPVRYMTHEITPNAIFPDLKVPPGTRVWRWVEYKNPVLRLDEMLVDDQTSFDLTSGNDYARQKF